MTDKKSFNTKQKLLLLFLSTAVLEYNKKDINEARSVLYKILWTRLMVGMSPSKPNKNIPDMNLKELNDTIKKIQSDKERLNGLVEYSGFAIKLSKKIKNKYASNMLELIGRASIVLELIKRQKNLDYKTISNVLGEAQYHLNLSKLDQKQFEKKYKTEKSQKQLVNKYKKPKEMIKIVNAYSWLIKNIAKKMKIDLFKVNLLK